MSVIAIPRKPNSKSPPAPRPAALSASMLASFLACVPLLGQALRQDVRSAGLLDCWALRLPSCWLAGFSLGRSHAWLAVVPSCQHIALPAAILTARTDCQPPDRQRRLPAFDHVGRMYSCKGGWKVGGDAGRVRGRMVG